MEYLIQVLKTSSYGSKPSKTAAPSSSTASAPNLLPLMAVEIFFRVFESRATWPVEVVDAYLDDAIHFRMWVDASEGKPFLLQLHQRINDVEDKEKEEVSLREYLVRSLRRIVLEINSTSKQSKVTTFSLIETLTTFVSVPEIRAELPVLIDKWSTNPAFATSVKRLLEKLATSLQSTSSNSLFLTDGPVLQTLIRSRQYLKTEEFRAILQVLLLGNIEVAIETSKYLFLSDDSQCKAFKPETVKLFISILSSSTNSSYDLTTFLTAFFQAVLQICLPFFSSVQSKTITELFMRLLRFLPSQQIQVLRFFSDTQLQLQTFCVFESDITKMYLDMSSSMVLSLVHDVIGIEKELLGITKPPNASAVRNIPVLPKKPSSSLFISKSNPVVKSGRTSNPAMEISKDEGKKLDVVGLTADKEGLLERISNLQIICLSFLTDILKNSCTAPASGAYAVDTVSKILGMNLNYYNKLNVESAYPNSSLYLKENGVVALDSILYSARIFKYACGCIEDLTAGIDVIETLLLKGLRNKIKFGTHNSAVEVVSTLLSLAHVVILTPDEYANIDTSTLPCVSSFLTKEEEASSSGSYSPEISVPPMAIRSLYWRTHLFLAALACNVPNILGDYVWQYLPSVRVLLSMTISNKFNTSQLTPPILSTTQIATNSTSSFSHQNVSLFFSSKGVEVITKGDVKHMEETLMEGESQLWDALFLFGFPFRGQLSSSSGSLSKGRLSRKTFLLSKKLLTVLYCVHRKRERRRKEGGGTTGFRGIWG